MSKDYTTQNRAKSIQRHALKNYETGSSWPTNSPWYHMVQKQLDIYSRNWIHQCTRKGDRILIAGCGTKRYRLPGRKGIYMDLVGKLLADCRFSITGSIEKIPLKDASVDAILCVGSVLNYVSAVKALSEFQRILRPGGKLLLEFENSKSFEFIPNGNYKKPCFWQSFDYNGQQHPQWTYSEQYIRSILKEKHMHVTKRIPFHILSSMALGFGFDVDQVAFLARADRFLRPLSKISASNIIYFIEKN